MLTYFVKGIELELFVETLRKSYHNPSKEEQLVLAIMDKMISDFFEEHKNENKYSFNGYKTIHFDPEYVGGKEHSIKKYELNLYSNKEPFLVIEFFAYQSYFVISLFHSFEKDDDDKPWNLFFSKE